MLNKKPIILVFSNYYLPGCKSGGPVRAIFNLVEHLYHDFDFYIVTSDRDTGDEQPYAGIQYHQWQRVDKAWVYYCAKNECTLMTIARLMRNTPHDLLYLPSLFNPVFTLKPLLIRFVGRLSKKPVVLAPKGECSSAALKISCIKKKIYLVMINLLGIKNQIIWQVSSQQEHEDVQKCISVETKFIHVALDLSPLVTQLKSKKINSEESSQTSLRVIFLSRIVPMKNLDYALEILKKVRVNVVFNIYGPQEDMKYWNKCQALIELMPANIHVNYCGSVAHTDVSSILLQHDLFFLPTRGENYGYVIAESLAMGTPVLISDQTPWTNLDNEQLGWTVSLDNQEMFVNLIERHSMMKEEDREALQQLIQKKIMRRGVNLDDVDANRQLFLTQLQRSGDH